MIVVATLTTPLPPSAPYDTETDVVGGIPADLTEFDLNQSSYGGLANGDTARWRVQVLNDHGEWSDWSDWARFTRVDKGTVTITTPGNTVAEFTPPVAWTTTFTQMAWRLMVFDDSLDEDTPIHDTGRKNGDTQEYTIPSKDDASGKRVLRDGRDYRLVVRAWDGVDRVATSGDPRFVEDVVVFAYVDDPTPDQVTSLVAVAVGSTPYIDLTWQRSTTPDGWTITDNGTVVDTLSGTDPLLSGTSYKYRYKDAKPYVSHVLRVKPTVNGLTAASPSATVATNPKGVWVLGADTGDADIDVLVTRRDIGDFSMPDRGTTFVLPGVRSPVRITQGVGGYQGTISGNLTPGAGHTTESWRDRLLALKKRGTPVTLVLGGESFRAVIFNIKVAPTADGISRDVSFEFFQVGAVDWLD